MCGGMRRDMEVCWTFACGRAYLNVIHKTQHTRSLSTSTYVVADSQQHSLSRQQNLSACTHPWLAVLPTAAHPHKGRACHAPNPARSPHLHPISAMTPISMRTRLARTPPVGVSHPCPPCVHRRHAPSHLCIQMQDLSLAWATTPYTSLTLEKLPPVAAGPPSGASSACGSGCASLASPGSHASLSVPQMPSLGAGILPSPFVPAGVQPARKDDFAARGSVGSAASFSLCRPGGGAAAGEQQRQQQQQLTEGLQGTCSRDGDGCNRESLGAAVMTPVLMHPFVVATPVPPVCG